MADINHPADGKHPGEVYILSAVRTPLGVGKPQGALAPLAPVDLTVLVMQEALRRAGVDSSRLEDVIWGCVTPVAGQGTNLARLAVLKAGFPSKIPGVTLNRMGGASQQALHFAAQAILAGDMDLVLAGGTASMRVGGDYLSEWQADYTDDLARKGVSAELMAEKLALDRESLDDYAFQSHLRAMQATQEGRFESQILPILRPDGLLVRTDEGVRMPPDREQMRSLRPIFKPDVLYPPDGVITAGNSSQTSDGAAALLLASPRAVGRLNVMPRARILARTVVGSDPALKLDAPIPATRQALKRANLDLGQMDVIEIDEAFASVVLAWGVEFGIRDWSRINPNGGAIALGHPLGATGAALMTKLVHELERCGGRYGLQVMCIGHGMAAATILERI